MAAGESGDPLEFAVDMGTRFWHAVVEKRKVACVASHHVKKRCGMFALLAHGVLVVGCLWSLLEHLRIYRACLGELLALRDVAICRDVTLGLAYRSALRPQVEVASELVERCERWQQVSDQHYDVVQRPSGEVGPLFQVSLRPRPRL